MSDPAETADDPFVGLPWIQPATGLSRVRRRVISRRRRHRRRLRRSGWVLLALGGAMIATGAWVGVTGLLARHELTAMKAELGQLRHDVSDGNITDARSVASALAAHAHRAHELTSGPAWWVTANIPDVGAPFQTARGISASADLLGARAVPQLVAISAALDPRQWTSAGSRVDITALVKLVPQLNVALSAADSQQRRIAALPHDTWMVQLNNGADQVDAALSQLVGSLSNLDHAARTLPTLLGYTSPQRYFIGFQNESEARGTGGLPGAFGILLADHGTLRFTHFGSDGELGGVGADVDFGAAYEQAWHNFNPTGQYLNSNVDPDFRYAAQIWAKMWQRKSGEHVDGALSVDPTALSYLLAVTGPAALPDGTQISASNIVARTESTVYASFEDQAQRKAYLLDVARAVEQRIVRGGSNSAGLFHAAGKAVAERRLLLWDADPAVESVLSAAPIGGAVPVTAESYVGPVFINYGANKLDYYRRTAVAWRSAGCGLTNDVTVTITVTNTAPSGLPAYVTARTDKPGYPVRPGDNSVLLYYLGSQGGMLRSITIDGHPGTVTPGIEAGHPTYSTLVELPRGKTQTIVLSLVEPSRSGPPVLLRQPGVTPTVFSTHTVNC